MVRTGEQRSSKAGPDGKLASNPSPLTLKDLEEQPEGSARRVVIELIFSGQWGNSPNIAEIYHPAVEGVVGLQDLLAAYDLLRGQLAGSQARLISSSMHRGRASIRLELLSKTNTPVRETFVLTRADERWQVISDTLLERGLAAWITQQTRATGRSAAAANAAGARKAAEYRVAFTRAR